MTTLLQTASPLVNGETVTVSVLQFLLDLSEREADEAVRCSMPPGWRASAALHR